MGGLPRAWALGRSYCSIYMARIGSDLWPVLVLTCHSYIYMAINSDLEYIWPEMTGRIQARSICITSGEMPIKIKSGTESYD